MTISLIKYSKYWTNSFWMKINISINRLKIKFWSCDFEKRRLYFNFQSSWHSRPLCLKIVSKWFCRSKRNCSYCNNFKNAILALLQFIFVFFSCKFQFSQFWKFYIFFLSSCCVIENKYFLIMKMIDWIINELNWNIK